MPVASRDAMIGASLARMEALIELARAAETEPVEIIEGFKEALADVSTAGVHADDWDLSKAIAAYLDDPTSGSVGPLENGLIRCRRALRDAT